jgi:hypothetical protein
MSVTGKCRNTAAQWHKQSCKWKGKNKMRVFRHQVLHARSSYGFLYKISMPKFLFFFKISAMKFSSTALSIKENCKNLFLGIANQ